MSSSEDVRKAWQKIVYVLSVADQAREKPMARLIGTRPAAQAMCDQAMSGHHQSGHYWPLRWGLRVNPDQAGTVSERSFELAYLDFQVEIPNDRLTSPQTANLRLTADITRSGWVLEGRGAMGAWSRGLRLLKSLAKDNALSSSAGPVVMTAFLNDEAAAGAIAALVGEADYVHTLLNDILTGK